ncbi:MAG: hypothetical protein FJZ08_02045 [Candidatus Omnitrophica bacterium]|nr:hypothetical protein [Candidatus Omnitrophota bacterium]
MKEMIRTLTISMFFILGLLTLVSAEEKLTITTFYPSPYGVYNDLRSNVIGVGSSYRATSLTDGQMVVVGNMAIGTTTLTYALNVGGDINVTGDIRKSGAAYTNPDYVFEPTYNLMPIAEVKKFITQNRHLPGMPSTHQVQKEGVMVFEQNRLLLEKIEVAYLYIMQLEERIAELEKYKK